MSNLMGALEMLQILTEALPPAQGQRHNITLDGPDALQVSVMLDVGRIPITIDGDDLERPIGGEELGGSAIELVRTLSHLLQQGHLVKTPRELGISN